jgi:glucose/arabinose dehydrogenase
LHHFCEVMAARSQRPDLVSPAVAPDYAFGARTASLGMTFYRGTLLPQLLRRRAFIVQHGSWKQTKAVIATTPRFRGVARF